ncbi:MAG TPA: Rv3654c family TadE-like protein [Micromonosporaceae bacterium]|nr:Rv3654c family TadE-like protein [Micromonosporaceae bacterium]
MIGCRGPARLGEAGGAAVWVLAAGLLTMSVAMTSAAAGGAVLARHRAEAAADLGALAGATHVLAGPESACAAAEEIVVANGARLSHCEVDGLDVVVTVAVRPSGMAAVAGAATARARAGPVS